MIGIIGAVIAIFIIIGGIFAYINAQPKSIVVELKNEKILLSSAFLTSDDGSPTFAPIMLHFAQTVVSQ